MRAASGPPFQPLPPCGPPPRYGNSPEGYAAFVEEQVSAFEACVTRQQAAAAAAAEARAAAGGGGGGGGGAAREAAERKCAVLFESLGYREERVFFHADQVGEAGLVCGCGQGPKAGCRAGKGF
jgi:hypothetical protein